MSHTFYYSTTMDKERKEHSLEVEVDSDGSIKSAIVYIPMFDDWVDCTKRIQNSDYYSKKVAEDWAEYKQDEADARREDQYEMAGNG